LENTFLSHLGTAPAGNPNGLGFLIKLILYPSERFGKLIDGREAIGFFAPKLKYENKKRGKR
jgi:hypothetical protein